MGPFPFIQLRFVTVVVPPHEVQTRFVPTVVVTSGPRPFGQEFLVSVTPTSFESVQIFSGVGAVVAEELVRKSSIRRQ